MRITTHLIAAAIALAIASSAAPAPAQTPSNDGRPSGMVQAGETGASPFIAELDFKGGPFDAFVKALREAAGGQPVNIVYPPEAGGLPVPPVSLRDVDVYTALRVAQPGTTNPLRIDGRPVIWRTDRISGGGAPVYQIEVRDIGDPRTLQSKEPQIKRHTVVHTITELITGTGAMSADDVLSALQAAVAMEEGQKDGQEVKLAYHEGTGLLFARVTADQAEVISNTIMSLRVSRDARGERERRDPLESTLAMVGAKDVNDLIMKINMAKNLRNQILDLQAINAEQQNRIIMLQDELAGIKRYLATVERKLKDDGN